MTTRTRDRTWTFAAPFALKGVDRLLPAGSYRVATDEELLEGLSFPVYRRVATTIFAPGRGGSLEMLSIDPADLQAAPDRDAAAREAAGQPQASPPFEGCGAIGRFVNHRGRRVRATAETPHGQPRRGTHTLRRLLRHRLHAADPARADPGRRRAHRLRGRVRGVSARPDREEAGEVD